jgi:hypothetical protein
MDSQLFRNQTSPNFTAAYNGKAVTKAVKQMNKTNPITAPIDDPRYPKYASIMEDGRLITEYQSHCATNSGADPKYGNSIRGFLQHNADALIQVSRKRQAERVGAQFQMANTVVKPKMVQKCDEYDCTFSVTDRKGLGLERSEGVPHLFGTFNENKTVAPYPNVTLTSVFEGGRNTPRGRDYVPLGLKSFNPRNSQYA